MRSLSLCLLQNGYPARRRSLVDDARFETLVVKQTKQSVLEEARTRANGKFFFVRTLIVEILALYKYLVDLFLTFDCCYC